MGFIYLRKILFINYIKQLILDLCQDEHLTYDRITLIRVSYSFSST